MTVAIETLKLDKEIMSPSTPSNLFPNHGADGTEFSVKPWRALTSMSC